MATRFYFRETLPPAFAPAFDASWESTGSAVRRRLETSKIGAALESLAVATTLNSPAGAVDVLIAQFVSEPISSSVTISGTIKGQMRAQESNAAGDLRSQCVIRVIQSDGTTVRGTLVASDGSALTSEWATALTNRKMPLNSPVTPTSVTAQAGDRIVVEVGYRKHENATTSRTGTISVGATSGGTDLAEDETTTTANIPWIEFTEAISVSTGAMLAHQTAEVVTLPADANARLAHQTAEVVVSRVYGLAAGFVKTYIIG